MATQLKAISIVRLAAEQSVSSSGERERAPLGIVVFVPCWWMGADAHHAIPLFRPLPFICACAPYRSPAGAQMHCMFVRVKLYRIVLFWCS